MNTPSAQQASEKNKCLILVDGYGFLFRAYHSMPPLTRADGTPTGAIYGFCNMLMKLLGDHEGDYIAVALDAGKKTFRNEIYSDYKANRPPPPDDLIPQFPLVREAVEAFNLITLQSEGYEADDLIATYTKRAKQQGLDVLVVSSDKDLMQLVDDQVTMFDPLKSRFIKQEQVEEKFGVTPKQVLDVLALMGDSSDNIPGVPGIGPKIAAELIQHYNGLDNLLENSSEIKQKKRRENLIEFKDQAILSRELASLAFDAPTEYEIEQLKFQSTDSTKLSAFLKEQNFKSLYARVNAGASFELAKTGAKQATPTQELNKKTLNNSQTLQAWISSFRDIETISVALDYSKTEEILAISLAINNYDTAYIPLSEDISNPSPANTDLFAENNDHNQDKTSVISIKQTLSILKPYLEDKAIWVLAYDAKPFLRLCYEENIQISALEDVMLMAYLLYGTSQKLDIASLAAEHLALDIAKTDHKSDDDARQEALHQSSHAIAQLGKNFKQEINANKLSTLYERIERPLVKVLASMEHKGITLDRIMLKKMSDNFAEQLAKLEQTIHKQAGCEFNIGSPKQLGEVLFDTMGLEGGKKSKTGAYGTDASVLETLASNGHPIAENILHWRQTSKLKSTYTDALPKQIKQDGRVHTHYAMAATSTGRLSSATPNLQNIPTRTEEGNKIRQTFVAGQGKKLISADYSQIELRLIAHMADIPTLKEAFKNELDIHAATASQVFDTPLEDVTSELRRKAKAINFGIIYGMSAFGLANRLRISRSDAKHYIETYFQQYPGIRRYMDATIESAKSQGFVSTLFGRKCYIKDISGKNPAMRQFAERAAINAPLQGTAADIIKKAMVELHSKLKEKQLPADILLQVHDELILEVEADKAEEIATLVKKTMEQTASFSVPLTVDVGIGNNWAEIHG